MDVIEDEILFEQAVSDYRRGSFRAASETLTRLVSSGSQDPAHLSYCGLLLALTGERDRGVTLCERAVVRNGRRASLLYLNLSRALDVAGRKRDAIESLRRGLLVHPEDRLLRNALQHLVPRARPFFSSLHRHHFLNRYAGLARTMSGRVFLAMKGRGEGV
jgi:predicted Zn-dependent protease